MNEQLIRLSRPTDINNIVALDLKCYPYPLTMEQWQKLVHESGKNQEPKVVLIEIKNEPIGFVLWKDLDNKVTEIIRMGVLRPMRKLGAGRTLMAKCEKESVSIGSKILRTVVPEIHCNPGDPDDSSAFLNKMGFKPTGKILSEYRVMYGDKIDGFIFEKEIA